MNKEENITSCCSYINKSRFALHLFVNGRVKDRLVFESVYVKVLEYNFLLHTTDIPYTNDAKIEMLERQRFLIYKYKS